MTFTIWHLLASLGVGVGMTVWFYWTERVENELRMQAQFIRDHSMRLRDLETVILSTAGGDGGDDGAKPGCEKLGCPNSTYRVSDEEREEHRN